jgi:hypothetical protein
MQVIAKQAAPAHAQTIAPAHVGTAACTFVTFYDIEEMRPSPSSPK